MPLKMLLHNLLWRYMVIQIWTIIGLGNGLSQFAELMMLQYQSEQSIDVM